MTIQVYSVRSIQFLPDRVVVEYADGKVFQFCKYCRNGKHLKHFLNDYKLVGGQDLVFLDEITAIRMERKAYHQLAYGSFRRNFHKFAVEFGEYAARRCGFYGYQQAKKEVAQVASLTNQQKEARERLAKLRKNVRLKNITLKDLTEPLFYKREEE